LIGGAVGDSSYNAQLAGVIGQNAVENNGISPKQAKAKQERLNCERAGVSSSACTALNQPKPSAAEKILSPAKSAALDYMVGEEPRTGASYYIAGLGYVATEIFFPESGTDVALTVVGGVVGKAVSLAKKEEKLAEVAAQKRKEIENNFDRDNDLWSNKPSGKQQYDPAFEKLKKIINPKIAQSQNKHILDHKQYAKGKSYFHNSEDAQKVLDAFHKGEAKIVGYNVQKQPIVKFEGGSGIYSTTNLEGKKYSSQTDYYIIKGTQKVSIVPFSPRGPK
jgi:hypothetical protein